MVLDSLRFASFQLQLLVEDLFSLPFLFKQTAQSRAEQSSSPSLILTLAHSGTHKLNEKEQTLCVSIPFFLGREQGKKRRENKREQEARERESAPLGIFTSDCVLLVLRGEKRRPPLENIQYRCKFLLSPHYDTHPLSFFSNKRRREKEEYCRIDKTCFLPLLLLFLLFFH